VTAIAQKSASIRRKTEVHKEHFHLSPEGFGEA